MTVNGKQKWLNAIIWNQKWEAVSSIETLMKGGVRSLSMDWKSAVFSLNGLHTVMFLTMIVALFWGNKYCTGVNEDFDARTERARQTYALELEDDPYGAVLVLPEQTQFEHICGLQKQFLGQIAIAVLVLTVLRQLIPRAKAAGKKRAEARDAAIQAQAKKS